MYCFLFILVVFLYSICLTECRLWNTNSNNSTNRHHRKLINANAEHGIPMHYIVHFNNDSTNMTDHDVTIMAKNVVQELGGDATIFYIYQHVFQGVAISFRKSQQRHIDQLLNRSFVTLMDQDVRIKLDDWRIKPNDVEPAFIQVNDVPYGLDRIDQKSLPLDDTYTYQYVGRGVTIFVLDTGIAPNHTDFQNRADCQFDSFVQNDDGDDDDFFDTLPDDDFFADIPPEPKCQDTANHGTAVAGIISGWISGVAKKSKIISVKVISESGGSAASVIAGIDFVMSQRKLYPDKPFVVNMSLGAIFSRSVNQAVERLVDAGVTVVTAAGNSGLNACLFSPASSKRVITVGASTFSRFFNRDRRALFSNYGPCVDIFAPGARIVSASALNQTSYDVMSGTSLSAPHVTGVVAMYLERDPSLTPDQIREALLNDALRGELIRIYQNFSPNRLLYIGNLNILTDDDQR